MIIMNRFLFYLFLFTLSLISLPVLASAPVIQAKAAVLMDMKTGQVVWERNSRDPLPPASTTKVLTAILAYDMGNTNKLCAVSPKAASVGEASIHLKAGEKILLGDLLKGALICSGNDACVAIAENVSGSESLFVQWMNLKAKILGAGSSEFVNTNGLPAKDHYVTAYDLALISRYAMQNPQFSAVVGSRYQTIGQGTSKRYLKSTNKLLWQYPGCIGIKTGTTVSAGPCLVSAGERGEKKFLSVVLNSPDRFGDSSKLLDYGLEDFSSRTLFHRGDLIRTVPVINGMKKTVAVIISQDETVVLPKQQTKVPQTEIFIQEQLAAPVQKGQSLGHIDVLDNNRGLLSRINIVADESIPERLTLWEKLKRLCQLVI
ncbi:D-alanyl-D-alanine carboxypeptidase family protein [Candidatus Formimonas warabiya]|uniref:serine-type D-Ala-D-Ala carboxypeptidase n=1 Tax=Formimonas warabiya TaxID=1761012 RepID=A0A3G1KP21_FORW1|nr:D-alanyl-D-alanine carboxypeptidase family protein [Candidatus Formimonas warabiya]ATW24212.1 hypothetical protein DCMF_04890 [Candidatus Formimonas warabiya]